MVPFSRSVDSSWARTWALAESLMTVVTTWSEAAGRHWNCNSLPRVKVATTEGSSEQAAQ